MHSVSPSSAAAGLESALCHVPVLSVTVLGAAGALSSLAEGQSALKLLWPKVLHNYPFVVVRLVASWLCSHAFWLHGLITWKNGRGEKKSGQPPGTCDRRKVFVPPKSLQVQMSKRCIDSGTGAPARFSSPATFECHFGADQNPYGFVLSPAHKWLWVFLLVFLLFSSEAGKWRYRFLCPFPVSRLHAACGLTFPTPEARTGRSDTVLLLVVNAACLCFSLIPFYKIPNEKNYGRTNAYFPSFI